MGYQDGLRRYQEGQGARRSLRLLERREVRVLGHWTLNLLSTFARFGIPRVPCKPRRLPLRPTGMRRRACAPQTLIGPACTHLSLRIVAPESKLWRWKQC